MAVIIGSGGHRPLTAAGLQRREQRRAIKTAERAERLKALEAAYAPAVAADRAERAAKYHVTLQARNNDAPTKQRVEGIDVETVTFRRTEDFRSAPNARPMNKRDISNVEFLDAKEIEAMTDRLAEAAPSLFAKIRQKLAGDWAGLLSESEVWRLTEMATAKYIRSGQLPK